MPGPPCGKENQFFIYLLNACPVTIKLLHCWSKQLCPVIKAARTLLKQNYSYEKISV
jgi:hypothetical protein